MKDEYILSFTDKQTKKLMKQAEKAGYVCELTYLKDEILKKVLREKIKL